MKITFDNEDLLEGIQTVIGVTGGRNTLPILSNLLISASDNGIKMSATDLEVSIQTAVAGTVLKTGEITLPAKKLFEIVRSLPDDDVLMDLSANDRVTISCGNSHYKLAGLPSDEFPDVPKVSDDYLSVDSHFICEAIENTEFSASTDEVRYFLNGLYFNLTREGTEVVATDGRRMALVSNKEVKIDKEDPIQVIVPLKAVKEIAKVFSPTNIDLRVDVSEGQIIFSDGEVTLSSRLVEGDYPLYQNILPKENDIEVVYKKSDIQSALRRVSVMANPRTYSMTMDVKLEGTTTVTTKSPEVGEATDTVECETNGEVKIAFDSRFMIEAVNSIDAERVKFSMKDSLTAITITAGHTDSHLCLVMPMRLED